MCTLHLDRTYFTCFLFDLCILRAYVHLSSNSSCVYLMKLYMATFLYTLFVNFPNSKSVFVWNVHLYIQLYMYGGMLYQLCVSLCVHNNLCILSIFITEVGAIAGGVVGGSAGLAIGALATYCMLLLY